MLSRFLFRFCVLTGLWASSAVSAAAQVDTEGLFARPNQSDLALGWLQALFRGEPLFEGNSGQAFSHIAEAIHRVLGLYSAAMLVLAGFLLLYYTLIFIAQTAHTGQIAWMQRNKMWAPLRFALVMGLLVPVGGGLNLGQYVIVKLAEQGSSLASNAWEAATMVMKDSLTGLVAPRAPDERHLMTRAIEIALCQAIYHRFYDVYKPDSALASIGGMKDFDRFPPERLGEETWRLSNRLHENPPLCGAYRFLAPSSEQNAASKPSSFLSLMGDSSRAAAERLSAQAASFAESVAPAFTNLEKTNPSGAGPIFAHLLQDQQKILASRIAILAGEKEKIERDLLLSSQETGWIGAGTILLDLMNRQGKLGFWVNRSVPAIDPPLLGHEALNFKKLRQNIADDSIFYFYNAADLSRLYALYEKSGESMKKARTWLYGDQLADAPLFLASTLDVEDALVAGSDPEKGFAVFRRVMDAAFASFGVWGQAASDGDENRLTLSAEMVQRPMAALAEMGRRYLNLGNWMMGTAGRFLFEPSVMLSAAIYVFLSGLIALSGLALLFLVPMIPLFRFVAGVLMWILLVFESVVSVPLVAIAHMSPNGEGLASESARRAYFLWLSAIIRPFLIVFGFLAGWAGFFLGIFFLNLSFDGLIRELALVQTGSLTELRLFFTILYAVFVVLVSNVAFKGISYFPDRASEWLGGLAGGISHSAPIIAGRPEAPQISSPSGASSVGHGVAAHLPVGKRGTERSGSRKESSSPPPRSKESLLFPQFKEKDLSGFAMSRSEDGKNVAVSYEGREASAQAGVQTDKDRAIAIASAKASVIIGGDHEHALSDLAREAKLVVKGIKDEEESKKPDEEKSPKTEDEKEKE